MANYTTPTIDTYTVKEVLNKVINSGADALKVDIDNVTLTTEGSDIAIDVALDKANDSVLIYGNTNKAGSGTSYVPLVDADGHLQVDTLSSALPTGAATAANQATIIGHVDGIEGLLTTIDADTGAIKTAIELLDNAISGTEMQVDVVAALPSGTNTIGKVEVVGDVAENANAAGNPVLVAGRYDSPGNDNSSLRTLGDTDVGALALDPTGAVYVREALGQAGCAFVSGTSAVTAAYGKFVAIQFLEDTVFNSTNGLVATDTGRWADDSAAASDVSSSNTAAVGTQVFPQGMTIFGRWDSFILASGAVIAYVGNV